MNPTSIGELIAAAFILGMVAGMSLGEWTERRKDRAFRERYCATCEKEWRCIRCCPEQLSRNNALPLEGRHE